MPSPPENEKTLAEKKEKELLEHRIKVYNYDTKVTSNLISHKEKKMSHADYMSSQTSENKKHDIEYINMLKTQNIDSHKELEILEDRLAKLKGEIEKAQNLEKNTIPLESISFATLLNFNKTYEHTILQDEEMLSKLEKYTLKSPETKLENIVIQSTLAFIVKKKTQCTGSRAEEVDMRKRYDAVIKRFEEIAGKGEIKNNLNNGRNFKLLRK
jgi:hypothetical protein